jgi:hypothetical protein
MTSPKNESQSGKRIMAAATLIELKVVPTPSEINAALKYLIK